MTDREFVRYTVATLAYRAAKAMRGVPESFASFRAAGIANPPLKIVAHLGDLFDWGVTMLEGEWKWHTSEPTSWEAERDRFFASLKQFDDYLASDRPIRGDLAKCFAGPIADALTHTGQLAMLRRLHGSPMKGESYARAQIAIGRVGFEQTPAKPENEFD